MMRIFTFYLNILLAVLLASCGNDETTHNSSYVAQPSLVLNTYNLSHARLYINNGENAVVTFLADAFTYESPSNAFLGSWSAQTYVQGDVAFISSIEYTVDEGYQITTTFDGDTLNVGDRFLLSGDLLLSGTLTRIEVNNL